MKIQKCIKKQDLILKNKENKSSFHLLKLKNELPINVLIEKNTLIIYHCVLIHIDISLVNLQFGQELK